MVRFGQLSGVRHVLTSHAVCCNALTIDILGAVLMALFKYSHPVLKEVQGVKYLLGEKYVGPVSRQRLEAWHVDVRSSNRTEFLFCKAWLGLFSLFLPGFMCRAVQQGRIIVNRSNRM